MKKIGKIKVNDSEYEIQDIETKGIVDDLKTKVENLTNLGSGGDVYVLPEEILQGSGTITQNQFDDIVANIGVKQFVLLSNEYSGTQTITCEYIGHVEAGIEIIFRQLNSLIAVLIGKDRAVKPTDISVELYTHSNSGAIEFNSSARVMLCTLTSVVRHIYLEGANDGDEKTIIFKSQNGSQDVSIENTGNIVTPTGNRVTFRVPNDGTYKEAHFIKAGGKCYLVNYTGNTIINDLADVSISSTVKDGDALVYSKGTWYNKTTVSNLTDLSDTTITSPKEGDTLIYSNGKWINGRTARRKGGADENHGQGVIIDAANYDFDVIETQNSIPGVSFSSKPKIGNDYTLFVRNNGSSNAIDVTVPLGSWFWAPNGKDIRLSVPAGGYAEISFLYIDRYWLVRGA